MIAAVHDLIISHEKIYTEFISYNTDTRNTNIKRQLAALAVSITRYVLHFMLNQTSVISHRTWNEGKQGEQRYASSHFSRIPKIAK